MPKFCPACGKPISEKVIFCPHCGADIESFSSSTEKKYISYKGSQESVKSSSEQIGIFTKLSGIVSNVKTVSETTGSVNTNFQGYAHGRIRTDIWTTFRVNNRPCSCLGDSDFNDGDNVIVAGEGSAKLQVLAWYNKTTKIYKEYTVEVNRWNFYRWEAFVAFVLFVFVLGSLISNQRDPMAMDELFGVFCWLGLLIFFMIVIYWYYSNKEHKEKQRSETLNQMIRE